MEKNLSAEKLAISIDEMAEALGISRNFAMELVKREDFPAVWLSAHRVIIPVDGLKWWLAKKGGYDAK